MPLCGDCPFTWFTHSKGHRVTCVDAVDVALAKLQRDFGDHGVELLPTPSASPTRARVLRTADGSASIICADFFDLPAALDPAGREFTVVYDKDAFGAIAPERRDAYARAVAAVCARGASIFVEGKAKAEAGGPPFNLDVGVVERHWGAAGFELVEHFPSLYTLTNSAWKQQGFLLKLTCI